MCSLVILFKRWKGGSLWTYHTYLPHDVCRHRLRGRAATMQCPAAAPDQHCIPLWSAACTAFVCVLLSGLLCSHWFKIHLRRRHGPRAQPKTEQAALLPEVPAVDQSACAQVLLQHSDRLCVEVSSLLGRGCRSFIFKGSLSPSQPLEACSTYHQNAPLLPLPVRPEASLHRPSQTPILLLKLLASRTAVASPRSCLVDIPGWSHTISLT